MDILRSGDRLDGANQALVELKSEIQDKPPRVIDKTIKKMERLLDAGGANLGLYSYDSSAWVRKARMIPATLNLRLMGVRAIAEF